MQSQTDFIPSFKLFSLNFLKNLTKKRQDQIWLPSGHANAVSELSRFQNEYLRKIEAVFKKYFATLALEYKFKVSKIYEKHALITVWLHVYLFNYILILIVINEYNCVLHNL